jgi:hypothetical protein
MGEPVRRFCAARVAFRPESADDIVEMFITFISVQVLGNLKQESSSPWYFDLTASSD